MKASRAPRRGGHRSEAERERVPRSAGERQRPGHADPNTDTRTMRPSAECALLVILSVVYRTQVEAVFSVQMLAPRHVILGHSALLRCDYSVSPDLLHKVEWLRGGTKIFQFIKGRLPPFREYSISYASIDRNESDEKQLMLRNLQFEASGPFYCEVSTQAPIFTRSSDVTDITVIQSQSWAPQVYVGQAVYHPGDFLRANCTTSPAKPAPSIMWLLNGQKIPGSHYQQSEHRDPENEHLLWSTSRLKMHLTEVHVGLMTLTCIAAVPGFMGEELLEYVDQREHSGQAEVVYPSPMASGSSSDAGRLQTNDALILILLGLLSRPARRLQQTFF